MVGATIDTLVDGGIYINIDNFSTCYPDGLKSIPFKDQRVVWEVGFEGVTLNRKVKDPYGTSDLDFSRRILSKKHFLRALHDFAMCNYNWNHMGAISRPIKLDVDTRSVKLSIYDIIKIDSRQQGEYVMKLFGVRYRLKGIAQFGGIIGFTEAEKYERLINWASETLPHSHSIFSKE